MPEIHVVDVEDVIRIHVEGAVLTVPAAVVLDLVRMVQGLPIAGDVGRDGVIKWRAAQAAGGDDE